MNHIISKNSNKTKAQTLKYIEKKVTLFEVPELEIFDTNFYYASQDEVINAIKRSFCGATIAIRSSANDEDGKNTTCAGEYDSVLNISSFDVAAIHYGFETVIASYKRKGSSKGNNEIIVQKMIQNTSMSGVVFTHDLNTGAPYYVINYDDVSGLTNTVTSGDGEYANRTLYIHRSATKELRSSRFKRLIRAIQELEQIMDSQFLDIEFAMGEDYTPYLLQVRKITTQPNWNKVVAKRIDSVLSEVQEFVKTRFQATSGVYGQETVLGQMPDWNPAEMIGRAPRALACSLYKTLITDSTWQIARKIMGYAVPQCQPLMLSLAGQPFIDTRLSFNSFLPVGLSSEISEKLVNRWIERLKASPELHDKIEFEIAITTFSFDIDEKINVLVGDALTPSESSIFKEALRKQTHNLLIGIGEASINESLGKIDALSKKQVIVSSTNNNISSLLEMIDDCIHLGTIPFAILARHGFIARTILLSLNKCGILSNEDINAIQSGIRTVAGELVNDMHHMQQGILSREKFMEIYGHLRPGTYDILSQRYDQMTNLGTNSKHIFDDLASHKFLLSENQTLDIERLLKSEGFTYLSAEGLLEYIRAATVGREYGKFIFTRTVSNMLELIANFGKVHGLSREVLSHTSINNLIDIMSESSKENIKKRLSKISTDNAEMNAISTAIRLPQILFDEAGVHIVPFQVCHPNFITNKNVSALCVYLLSENNEVDLTGKIVLIENADPGFDWIFTQLIGGLITKYGGANSHMAIRCAEFGIPAAIGCGEQHFEAFINSSQILLDCSSGLITPFH